MIVLGQKLYLYVSQDGWSGINFSGKTIQKQQHKNNNNNTKTTLPDQLSVIHIPGKGGTQWDFLHLFLKRHLPYLINKRHISLPEESRGTGSPDLV